MALQEIRVPDIGGFDDVTVIEVFVEPGDAVKLEQSLITVESDKASMEIPSSAAGVIREMKVKLGDKINMGDLLAIIEADTPATSATPPQNAAAIPIPPLLRGEAALAPAPVLSPPSLSEGRVGAAQPQPDAAPPSKLSPTKEEANEIFTHASPLVRKFARELGVPLDQVGGSGPAGRITQQDVQNFTSAVMSGNAQTNTASGDLSLPAWPQVDFAKFGPIERKELSRIKKISGPNLLRNAALIPAVTNHDDADITDLETFRAAINQQQNGIKVTLLALLIKASAAALKKFPDFNSSLDGDALIIKNYWHIGFAADTPGGLVVPVIRDADQKGILQISQETAALASKAREGKLSPADMSGASFTISSLGGIGGRYFTPITNAPEVAILGAGRASTQPVWTGKKFRPRLLLPLSLTWDHRATDGAAAARFITHLSQLLTDLRRVLL